MRILRLLSIFYRNALYTEMEYRANFIANAFMSAFWLAFAILGLRVFFYHRTQIGGWGYLEAMLVVGFFTLFSGLIEALLQPNMNRIIDQIRRGTFDFVLLKPVDSQFMASLRHLSIWKLADVVMGAGICIYAAVRLDLSPTVGDLLIAGGFMACGAVILYSIWLMLVTAAFWFVRIDNITELFTAIYETGRFPVSVYPSWMRGVLTFVVPIAFITTFPAAAVLGRAEPWLLAAAVLLAAALFAACTRFWRYAVRHYSSASS